MAQYTNAAEAYDTAFMESLFDDRMILTSTNGQRRNKRQEINDVLYKVPNLTLEYFVADSLTIIPATNAAAVAGVLKWKFKQHASATRRHFTFTFIKEKDWKIIAQHIGR